MTNIFATPKWEIVELFTTEIWVFFVLTLPTMLHCPRALIATLISLLFSVGRSAIRWIKWLSLEPDRRSDVLHRSMRRRVGRRRVRGSRWSPAPGSGRRFWSLSPLRRPRNEHRTFPVMPNYVRIEWAVLLSVLHQLLAPASLIESFTSEIFSSSCAPFKLYIGLLIYIRLLQFC